MPRTECEFSWHHLALNVRESVLNLKSAAFIESRVVFDFLVRVSSGIAALVSAITALFSRPLLHSLMTSMNTLDSAMPTFVVWDMSCAGVPA